MSTRKRSIYMSNLYTSLPTKQFFSFDSSNPSDNKEKINNIISKEIYSSCTLPLFISLVQMNKKLSQNIICEILTKGLK